MSWFTGGQMLNHWRSVKTRFSRVLSYSLICIFICPSFLMFWCIIFLQTLVEIQQIMCDLLQINTTTSFILWSCDKIKQSAANLKEFTVYPSKHSAANSLHEEESHLSAHYGGFFLKKKKVLLWRSAHIAVLVRAIRLWHFDRLVMFCHKLQGLVLRRDVTFTFDMSFDARRLFPRSHVCNSGAGRWNPVSEMKCPLMLWFL